MADVLEIARKRRAQLTAEIAALDDFIKMAEAMLLRADEEHPERSDEAEAKAKEPGRDATPVENTDAAAGESGPGATSEPESDQATRGGAQNFGDVARGSTSDDSTSDEQHISAPAPVHASPVGTETASEEDELVLTEQLSEEPGEDIEIDPAIGERIRYRRWNVGMTRSQLAEQLGIPMSAVQGYEEGDGRASASLMARLAGALGVSTSHFFDATSSNSADSVDAASEHNEAGQDPAAGALARTA